MAQIDEQGQLRLIKNAINQYYKDLDNRKHGDVAQNKAFEKIQSVLGMHWEQHGRRCPECYNKLKPVVQSSPRMLNEYQFDAIKAGDWFCDVCTSNASVSGYRYFWTDDLK